MIGLPPSQDDIHTLLVSSLVAISLPTPSKSQKIAKIGLIAAVETNFLSAGYDSYPIKSSEMLDTRCIQV